MEKVCNKKASGCHGFEFTQEGSKNNFFSLGHREGEWVKREEHRGYYAWGEDGVKAASLGGAPGVVGRGGG